MGRVQATTVGQKFTRQEFPKPESFVVEGKLGEDETPPYRPTPLTPSVRTDTGQSMIRGPATNVRLKSLRNVVNNKHLPQFVTYRMSQQPLQAEIDDYIEHAEINGFAVGAIVARRWGVTANWERPQMWGMIMVVKETHHEPQLPYAPFVVKWITNNEFENAWAEDLYCMVPAMDDGLIWGIVEAQGFDLAEHSADDVGKGTQ